MRFKYKFKEALQLIEFAFYPRATLIACGAFSVVVLAILGIIMTVIPKDSNWYNIVFALTTGAAGSFFVSIVVELASNYRHNRLAWYELQDYYSAVMEYEGRKQIMMQLMPHQRAAKKAHEEFAASGGVEESVDEPKDIIQITWKLLPRMIPVLRQTLDDKKVFLNEEEINELKNILSDYKQIQFAIKERILLSPMTYDALNHPDEDYLKSLYPGDIMRNMPEWIRKYLASKESQKACDRYSDAILTDDFLLSQFMENYDISQQGLDNYQRELDRREEEEYEPEDIDYDELDFSEPEDEEQFRSHQEEFDKKIELEQRPFVSWIISKSCQDISDSLGILEKSIQKKPYYGMMINYYKNSAKEPIEDNLSRITYEHEKLQLDKRLAKQKMAGEK